MAAKTLLTAAERKSLELTDDQYTVLESLFENTDDTTSAEALAEALGVKGKSLRAYMRSSKLRDQSTEKNNRWAISVEMAIPVVKHYTK